MCARHWRMVPRPLQVAVYDSYRREGRISENHREAVRVVAAAAGARAAVSLPPGTKALTIWQPWASLIMIEAKPWEFRRWDFSLKPHLARLLGQRIVIHAGTRSVRVSEIDDALERISEGESGLRADLAVPFLTELRHARLKKEIGPAPLGAALGTAVLGQPRNVIDLFGDQVADSDRLDECMFGWPVTDVERFVEPIPAAGAQGFWNWS